MKTKQANLLKLGLKIKLLRQALGMSQEELALEAGLDRTYVGGIERGERNVAILNLIKLAKSLNTTPSTLLENIT
ncbi:helix-turn-helix domain-containing protein [Chitinophaga pinensis]|uniref:Transcriptional regulator, XRE family n=1 Tax=Chitinophaga pinensis (strain ATCC 43595 / DSM 2588 / LMG 13176 / NBRC 15968 / NCIMB 11800 / UQM 2034) TaxID=485918 RepID=A0A979GN95_CHIPD|nr:helix-turn-helix transcriptional regulator [Chitinophaga pinensis]ACU58143.1 transcriptional regulator, XRE family [Chitinophaga pinensis DSM 2588]